MKVQNRDYKYIARPRMARALHWLCQKLPMATVKRPTPPVVG